ncbi:MAG: YlxQ-related RNA-binding protein [Enterococcus sp.]
MNAVNRQKVLNLIGLAMRAGKVVTGEGLTVADIRKNKAEFVFVASDASENTRKKIKDKSSYYKVPYTDQFLQTELSQAIGRPRMVLGITDRGFAKRIEELIKG